MSVSTRAVVNFSVVIPAAGIGSRFGGKIPKQYFPIGDRALASHTLAVLLACPGLKRLVVALSPEDTWFAQLPEASDSRIECVIGGSERADSVLNGLQHLAGERDDSWVLVHDMARPCITVAMIEGLLTELAEHPVGGILALPVNDTVKKGDRSQGIEQTLDRSDMWLAQTPQMFRYRLLFDALHQGLAQGLNITDEASAVEAAGHKAKLVAGNVRNLKVTRPDDLALAALYLGLS